MQANVLGVRGWLQDLARVITEFRRFHIDHESRPDRNRIFLRTLVRVVPAVGRERYVNRETADRTEIRPRVIQEVPCIEPASTTTVRATVGHTTPLWPNVEDSMLRAPQARTGRSFGGVRAEHAA